MERKLAQHLTDLFWAVAKECDGEVLDAMTVPASIRKAYEKAMRDDQVLRLYGKLLDKENGNYMEYARSGDSRDDAQPNQMREQIHEDYCQD